MKWCTEPMLVTMRLTKMMVTVMTSLSFLIYFSFPTLIIFSGILQQAKVTIIL